MQTLQQIVHEIADHLPEQATWDDVMYSVYVRQKIEEGLKDIEEGRTVSHEDAMQELLGARNVAGELLDSLILKHTANRLSANAQSLTPSVTQETHYANR